MQSPEFQSGQSGLSSNLGFGCQIINFQLCTGGKWATKVDALGETANSLVEQPALHSEVSFN